MFDSHPLQTDEVEKLTQFVVSSKRLLVLTGAGVSVPSGIPEYRDREGRWKHNKPVEYQTFIQSDRVYGRYWARSLMGWNKMGSAKPNAAHHALAHLEKIGKIDHLVTQNVDGLHHKAGQQSLINLHGSLEHVSCLTCQWQIDRSVLQSQMMTTNAYWFKKYAAVGYQQKPDGDTDIVESSENEFEPPFCSQCSGKLKPNVVFFGENIPAMTHDKVKKVQDHADALLVVGSSLMVFSGFRIVRDFYKRNRPTVILNQGITRADDLAIPKIRQDAALILPLVVSLISQKL